MTREELKSIPALASSIAYKEEALRDLRDAAISLSSPELGMRAQRGTYSDRTGTFAGRIIDLEAEIRNDRLTLAERRLEAHRLSWLLPEPLQSIIRCRYVIGMTWNETAAVTNYDVSYCFRLYQKGVKMLFDDAAPLPGTNTTRSNTHDR